MRSSTPMPTAANDAEARLKRLLEEFGARIRAIVVARCPRELGLDPDEVEQDVRLRLWQALSRERNIEQPASYVYRTTMSVIVDQLRRRRARPDLDPACAPSEDGHAATTQGPEDAARNESLGRALVSAVAALPERRRRPVQLYLQGCGTQEVGRLLGMSEATARNLVYRGLDELREALRGKGWNEDG